MGIQAVPYIRIVPSELGLVVSGVTDGTGTWNNDIDLATYMAGKGHPIPTGATGILLEVVNESSSATWFGIRDSSKNTASFSASMIGRSAIEKYVPMYAGGMYDIYIQSLTLGEIYVKGYTDASTVYFDPDQPLPVIPTTAGKVATTIPEVAANSIVIPDSTTPHLFPTDEPAFAWVNTSTTTLYQYGYVNASKQLTTSNGVVRPICAYIASGFNRFTSRTVQFEPTANGTFITAPVSYPGKAAVIVELNVLATNGAQVIMRPVGSTSLDISLTNNGALRHKTIPLDANGQFEYLVESTWVAGDQITIWGTVDEYSEPAAGTPEITFTDPVSPGGSYDLNGTTSGFGATINQLTLTDGLANSINIPVTSGRYFTIPELSNGTTILFGSDYVLTATDGTDTANTTVDYVAAVGYAVTTIGTPTSDPSNISDGWVTPLSTGDQIYYSTADSTIFNNDATYSTAALGQISAFVIYTDGATEQFTLGEPLVPSVTITDPIILGQDGIWVVENFVPITATVGGLILSNVSTSGYTAPGLLHNAVFPLFGTQSVVLTNAQSETIQTTANLEPGLDLAVYSIDSAPTINEGNIAFYITTVVGDLIITPTPESLAVAVNGVLPDGSIVSDAGGTQTWYHQRASDGLITQIEINLPDIGTADTTPDQFTFNDVVGVPINHTVTSNTITVAGVTPDVDISISIIGGTYSINGGAYTSANGQVRNGDTVSVRVATSSSYNTQTSTTLTIDVINDTFTVTTVSGVAVSVNMIGWTVQAQSPLLDGAYYNSVRP